MRVAVVSGPDPGHVFPAIALCLRLLDAGDEPILFTDGKWGRRAAEEGIPVPDLDWIRLTKEPDAGRWLHQGAANLARNLAPNIREVNPDLVVTDVLATCGGMAAELLDLPWAELSPHPLYLPSKGLPPIGSGLAKGVGVKGRIRDALLRAATARSIRQGHRQRTVARQSIGLPADDPGPWARLIATIPALEVPRPDWPANAHIVGPLLWEPTNELLTPPPGDGPLVMIAPSTAVSGAADMLGVTMEALHGKGIRAVISTFTPPGKLPDWARTGPGRQDDMLRRSSAVICGAGHGLLVKALLEGVPVVTVPGGGDQWEVANRVARQGSALIVRPPTVPAIRDAVRRVLTEPSFADTAKAAARTANDVADAVRVCREAAGQNRADRFRR